MFKKHCTINEVFYSWAIFKPIDFNKTRLFQYGQKGVVSLLKLASWIAWCFYIVQARGGGGAKTFAQVRTIKILFYSNRSERRWPKLLISKWYTLTKCYLSILSNMHKKVEKCGSSLTKEKYTKHYILFKKHNFRRKLWING